MQYTFMDIFAKCGGISEGIFCHGFNALAHFEIDHSCKTLHTCMKNYGYKDVDREVVECYILATDFFDRLGTATRGRDVDVIVYADV